MSYFTKTFKPDIIDGDISKVIASNADDAPFADGDILFDWHAVDIPLGTNAIVDGVVHMFGEDGAAQVSDDFTLLIAKSKDGAAPTTLGEENAAITGCFELPEVLMNVMTFEGTTNRAGTLALGFGSVWHFNSPGAGGHVAPIVIEPEHNALGGTTTNRIYVAGIAGGAFDFSTGVLANAGVSDDAATTIVTKTVDLRKAFRPGDVVYIHDVDTAIGTVSSLTDNDLTLTANNVGAISTNDELMNATPITVTLSFSTGK